MNILTAPPDFTLPAPTARRLGQSIDLAKPSPPSSSERLQRLGYPSPPMSDSPSPTRRLDQHHPGVLQPSRRGIPALNGLPPPPGALSVLDQAADPRRPLLPQYTRDQSLQQQYQTQLPHPQHPYQAPQPPSGPFTYHQPPGAPMHAPAFYPSVPVAAPYHSGYHGDLTSGPTYAANSVPTPQGPPTNDHALKTAKSARRTKAHVASACVNCKKAHLSCDAKRPCTRCVASNKQDTCYDVPHKKRGRPRLREDRTAATEEHPEVGGTGHGPAQGPVAQAWPIARHRRASSLRVLRSQRPDERPLVDQYTSPFSPPQPIDPLLSSRAQVPPTTDRYRETRPVAFLNIDLVVMKSNPAFQELFGVHGDVRGRGLGDLMESGQADILQRLRNELRDEREAREPAYMPPINPRGEQEALEAVSMHFVETVTQSYMDRPYTWSFRLRDGQIQLLRLNIRLAKSGIFFVALIIQPFQLPVSSPPVPPIIQPSVGLPGPGRVSGASPRIAPAPPPRELPYYDPTRPSPTTSGPPSPYGFPAGTNPLPQASQTSAYTTSPTAARGEPGYLPAYQTSQQGPPPSLLSSYPASSSRPPSATSEPSLHRTTTRPPRPESLQLPPLRGQQISSALVSPQFSDPGSTSLERVRRRDVAFPPSDLPAEPTPDSVKRRRLNIHEVLD